jgi:hypothetical protein
MRQGKSTTIQTIEQTANCKCQQEGERDCSPTLSNPADIEGGAMSDPSGGPCRHGPHTSPPLGDSLPPEFAPLRDQPDCPVGQTAAPHRDPHFEDAILVASTLLSKTVIRPTSTRRIGSLRRGRADARGTASPSSSAAPATRSPAARSTSTRPSAVGLPAREARNDRPYWDRSAGSTASSKPWSASRCISPASFATMRG